MKISHVNEMRNLDRRAIEEYGIPQEILMENAGQAAYFTILKEFGVKNKNFVFFCGVGSNGGDGLMADGINQNEGAESSLAWLLSLMTLQKLYADEILNQPSSQKTE